MSLWTRVTNLFRGDRVNREIDEELAAHIDEAIARGRDPVEARKALGPALRHREASRDVRLIPWLESLRADIVFGARQLRKNRIASLTAILSLAIALGGCLTAFRLIDALLLRSLPVTEPGQLFDLTKRGTAPEERQLTNDEWAYPAFSRMRDAAGTDAELIAISPAVRNDVSFGSERDIETAYVQYVSGRMFESFGLQPTVGRVLDASDDLTPGGSPYAVLSYDYWTSRFARDRGVVGRTFRVGNKLFEIVGVAQGPFSGIEPGTATGIFLPAMMNPYAVRDDATWIRTVVRIHPGVNMEVLRQKLNATSRAFEVERSKAFLGISGESLDRFLAYEIIFTPMAGGVSELQKQYRPALVALAILVGLVLFIACANVANLITAQAASRAREHALRVAIGAGRGRLVQLVLVESAMLAMLASLLGAMFAWWAAPAVVARINPPANPAHLELLTDWRVFAFGGCLTLGATLLFGLLPALRASSIRPTTALKGGADPHSRRHLMVTLVGVQAAFCVFVLLITGLFVSTFDRLANQPTGFSADRVLTLETVTTSPQTPAAWSAVLDELRGVPGVERVALAGWPLLSGISANNLISINAEPPSGVLTYFLNVSPGWLDTMGIPLKDGRDFRPGETAPGVAIVNDAFAKQYFNGENPIGKSFRRREGEAPYQVVGWIGDLRYRRIRESILPVAFVPFQSTEASGATHLIGNATFVVRTSDANPSALGLTLRQATARARSEFRVSNVRTQLEINQAQTVRERLLAMLALFFASMALLLAGIGLYGVLDYSVLQRRREIGIRMALGASALDIARRVTARMFSMVLAGGLVGLGLGLASTRYLESLLYQVKATDPVILLFPALAIILTALMGTLPAVVRAVRIDPGRTLGSD